MVADDCPPRVEAPMIEPVDVGATEFPSFEGVLTTMPAGRYTTSSLGVSVAVDLPTDGFRVPDQFGGRVVATGDDAVFLASVHLSNNEGDHREVDARPSDAIAIALRANADVFVSPAVLERAVVSEATEEEAVRMVLEQMRPEDMGEYEM